MPTFSKESKKQNYLCRISSGHGLQYIFAQGYNVGHGIAIVRPQLIGKDAFSLDDRWTAIDIESGLGVGCSMNKTFTSCLERLNTTANLLDRIYSARSLKSYKERIMELSNEKIIWRKSGYVL